MPSKSPRKSPTPAPAAEPFIRLSIRVQPKASRNRVRIAPDGSVRVFVMAPPADGAANRAVCELLAGAFSIPKSAVRIDKGDQSREKVIKLTGLTPEAVESRLKSIENSST